MLLGAGEIGHDQSLQNDNPERCYEGKVFRKLLLQYSQEYEEIRSALGNPHQRSIPNCLKSFVAHPANSAISVSVWVSKQFALEPNSAISRLSMAVVSCLSKC